jgi:ABC-2 type transport system permease protein
VSEPTLAGGVQGARGPRLLARAAVYELRKVTAFRTGFVVRELLRGLAPPLVMIFVYRAIFAAGVESIGGYGHTELVQYLLLVALFGKLVFHRDGLDLSEQIFEGYVTKYLVMPFGYFVLALGRFVQFLAVELVLVAALWAVGTLALPELWPAPASAGALAGALALVLVGSYCFFLTYFIVHLLAFWLDVVWTLLVMVGFVGSFVAGVLIPVSVMPAGLRAVFAWCFPYWTLSAPIELYLGRLETGELTRGLAVLLASAVLLDLARRRMWSAGLRRYTGSGM